MKLSKILPLALSFLLLFSFNSFSTASTTCIPSSNPFSIQYASWQSQIPASPGETNLPLTVSMVYAGGCQVNYASFQLNLPHAFTSSSGSSTVIDYIVNLAPYAQFQLTYTVNIAQNASLGIYQIPMTVTYNTQNFTGYTQSLQFSIQLLGYVAISAMPSTNTLLPGEVNNVILTLQNTGSGNATQLAMSLSQPVQGVAVLTQFPRISSLPTDSNTSFSMQVFVSNTLSQQAINIPLTITYFNPYGTQQTSQLLLSFYVQQSSQLNFISVSTLTPSLTIGQKSLLKIQINNTGSSPLISPVFSLSLPSGFAVIENSSYSSSGMEIAPHSTFVYEAMIISGPKVAEGAYTGQLLLSYTDSRGNPYSSSFLVGFLVTGSIQLKLQGLTYTAIGNSLTFSGTILNQGTSSAYYLQIYGLLGLGSSSLSETSYVGEVDPNTPVPFSLSFTLPQTIHQATVSLNLNASYMNDYGSIFNISIAGQTLQVQFSNSTSTTATTQSTLSTLQLLRLVIIIVILAAFVAAVIYLARRRKGNEEKVI